MGASPFPRHWIYDSDGRARRQDRSDRLQGLGRRPPSARTRRGATRTRRRSSPRSRRRSNGSCPTSSCAATPSRTDPQAEGRCMPHGPRGATGDELFLLLDGVLAVEVDGPSWPRSVPARCVGERAVLEGDARTSTLRARTASRIAAVPFADEIRPRSSPRPRRRPPSENDSSRPERPRGELSSRASGRYSRSPYPFAATPDLALDLRLQPLHPRLTNIGQLVEPFADPLNQPADRRSHQAGGQNKALAGWRHIKDDTQSNIARLVPNPPGRPFDHHRNRNRTRRPLQDSSASISRTPSVRCAAPGCSRHSRSGTWWCLPSAGPAGRPAGGASRANRRPEGAE